MKRNQYLLMSLCTDRGWHIFHWHINMITLYTHYNKGNKIYLEVNLFR